MAIDYEALLRRQEVRAALGPARLAEALEDEDFLPNLISDESDTVLSLGWDAGFSSSGGSWINEWNDLYFFSSSDHEEEGPFNSFEEAVALECFHIWTPRPELSSESLSMDGLLRIAQDLVTEDGESIRINDRRFVRSGTKFIEEPRKN